MGFEVDTESSLNVARLKDMNVVWYLSGVIFPLCGWVVGLMHGIIVVIASVAI